MSGGVGDCNVNSGTGSGDTCGGCEVVEDPRCTGAGETARALAVTPLLS